MPINIFTTIDDPLATTTTIASGINDAGQIVGQFRDASNRAHGFLLSGGSFITIDDPAATGPGSGTFVQGINDARQIVGSYIDARGSHGFLLSGGTFTTLNDPLATDGTQALGINDSGQIVGEYDDATGHHGFLHNLKDGTFTTLDVPGAFAGTTFALGINDAGQIVGEYDDASGDGHRTKSAAACRHHRGHDPASRCGWPL
ncbi:MAG: hypothetical protein E6G76_26320 [Alphaproteobacteria bacterium]|nr:MAG: hypothetical protein E6G76_26320 [Alphaproteobacteria bacterium]